ncbi:HIT family protein [Arthrobacter sp. HY1533]|uniref:HIT family protein n=1 Tax=Arthrobacter sp. HY1533 TaxID=2970919 RepID=UPI003FA48686
MAHLDCGFAVIGDVQWLPGYPVLLTERTGIDRLSELPRSERSAFLNSVDVLAEAVEIASRQLDPAFLRVNIDILGNTDPFLHAHIWPRYQWEAPEMRSKPVWLYPGTNWSDPATSLNSSHDPYRFGITAQIKELSPHSTVS